MHAASVNIPHRAWEVPTAVSPQTRDAEHAAVAAEVTTFARLNSAESTGALLEAYFRCPAEILPEFQPSVAGPERPGYFSFGRDAICYGRMAGTDLRTPCEGELVDSFPQVTVTPNAITLPFDPDEIIKNLRHERYTAQFRQEGQFVNELLRKAYYLIRPYMGVPVRRILQRIHLQGWDELKFPAWPVDTTVERIHRKLLSIALRARGIDKAPFIWFWPEGYSSCAVMTHDVEDENGKAFCGTLMDLDESAGIRSSFQIVPEDRYEVTPEFLGSIKSRGFEVNVHDLKHDGRLYAEHTEFLRRAERINSYVREFGAEGFRSGILYRNADWYSAFNFAYDMSIPNVGHLDPQRGGCCTVLPYFIGDIVELPLTCTQDYTLFQIMEDYSIDLWKRQIESIRQNNGLISFIVHPDYVIEQRARSIYKSLLDHLTQLRADGAIWSPLPRDVAAWWRQRSQMKLVSEDGKWRIDGPGYERARVAIAMLDGDTVIYKLAEQG